MRQIYQNFLLNLKLYIGVGLQGFQLKANDYLAKPFYPEELTARIRERFTSQLSGVAEDEMYAFASSRRTTCASSRTCATMWAS